MNKKHFFIPLILQPSLVKPQSLWLGGVSYAPKTGEASFHFSEPEALAQIKKYFPKLKPKIFLLVIHSVAEKFPEVKFPKNLTPVAFQNFIFEHLLSADDDSLQFGDVEFIAPEEVEKAAEVQFRKESIPNRLMRDPQRLGKIYYCRFPTYKTREQKLTALRIARLENLEFELITPDKQGNWLDLTDNDFEELLPLCSKDVKLGRSEEAVFKLFSLGVVTNRDEWVTDFDTKNLENKVRFFIQKYNSEVDRLKDTPKSEVNTVLDYAIKWTRAVKKDLLKGEKYSFEEKKIQPFFYRPFSKKFIYFAKELNEMQYQQPSIFGDSLQFENLSINYTDKGSQKPFMCFLTSIIPDLHYVSPACGTACLPLYRYNAEGQRLENITDWGVRQFREHYANSPKTNTPITKEDIFHYVYAVLHNPAYREKYKINLKRDFPRIPFYNDFWQWANWGKTLMDLHLNYEKAEEFPLERIENSKPKEFPKVKLRRDKKQPDQIILDDNTTLAGVPEAAWDYKLGNRSALEWVLDQYKEKNPRDETIREKFNTYRFADYKEEVIVLIKKVCTVSLRTVEVVSRM